jgi:hypothetical protein
MQHFRDGTKSSVRQSRRKRRVKSNGLIWLLPARHGGRQPVQRQAEAHDQIAGQPFNACDVKSVVPLIAHDPSSER